MLETEPPAGAAEPGLHLVDDEQRLALVAQPAHAVEVLGRRGLHAALALHRLEQHGRDAVVDAPRASASRSSNATWRNPVGSGWNVSCFCGWPVAASVVSVRPWNEPYALITW